MISPMEENLTTSQIQMYHRITKAVLIIVNSMSTMDIEVTLKDYQFTRINNNIRFERIDLLKVIREEYPRINTCSWILMD